MTVCVSGAAIVATMRRHGVTIRDLSARMGITLRRVREVRTQGIPADMPRVAVDWVQGITGERPTLTQEQMWDDRCTTEWVRARTAQ